MARRLHASGDLDELGEIRGLATPGFAAGNCCIANGPGNGAVAIQSADLHAQTYDNARFFIFIPGRVPQIAPIPLISGHESTHAAQRVGGVLQRTSLGACRQMMSACAGTFLH